MINNDNFWVEYMQCNRQILFVKRQKDFIRNEVYLSEMNQM